MCSLRERSSPLLHQDFLSLPINHLAQGKEIQTESLQTVNQMCDLKASHFTSLAPCSLHFRKAHSSASPVPASFSQLEITIPMADKIIPKNSKERQKQKSKNNTTEVKSHKRESYSLLAKRRRNTGRNCPGALRLKDKSASHLNQASEKTHIKSASCTLVQSMFKGSPALFMWEREGK